MDSCRLFSLLSLSFKDRVNWKNFSEDRVIELPLSEKKSSREYARRLDQIIRKTINMSYDSRSINRSKH